MPSHGPELIVIEHDDYHAEYVGTTADGRQFFLTEPFVPGGEEFLALYLFDGQGQLVEAIIESFGLRTVPWWRPWSRPAMNPHARRATRDAWLAKIGPVSYGRIEIAPFSVKRFDVEFGLLVGDVDDDEGPLYVELQPGNYMAFYEPWDSGHYDT